MQPCLNLRLLAAIAVAAVLTAGCASARPATATVNSATAKIAPILQAAAQQLQNGTPLPAHGPVRSDAQGRIQVYVYVSNTMPETVTALAGHGLQNMVISPALNVVQGWVKPSNLVNLAGLPFVMRITPPQYAQPR